MPNRGAQRFEFWQCPAFGAAGPGDHFDVGNFSYPMALTGIFRDGAGAATLTATLTRMVRASGGGEGKETIFDNELTTSPIFNSALAGGARRMYIPIGPGEVLRFDVHAVGAGATEGWHFELSCPDLPRSMVEELQRSASGK